MARNLVVAPHDQSMSVPVALEALWTEISKFGDHPYLVTVSPDHRSHVVSVVAGRGEESVVVHAGKTSRANVDANPAATLMWPAAPGGDYSLILDGVAEPGSGGASELVIRPTRAVL